MPKERYCARTVFDSPSYSQGVKVTGSGTFLYVSGQISQDTKGHIVGRGDFPAQARQVLKNLKAMVEAGGGKLSDVVKLTFFLTDVRYRQDLVPIREEFFGPKLPASTLITTPPLAPPPHLIQNEAGGVPGGGRLRPQGKVAIVTGAARGIGLAIAQRFVKEGAQVALADRLSAEVATEAGRLGPAALAIPTDVGDAGEVRHMVSRTVERFGRLDCMVSN